MLKFLDPAALKLSNVQQNALNVAWKDPATENIWLAKLMKKPEAEEKHLFKVTFPDQLKIPTYYQVQREESGFDKLGKSKIAYRFIDAYVPDPSPTFTGTNCPPPDPVDYDCRTGSAYISYNANNLYAELEVNGRFYIVRNIGEEIYAVIKLLPAEQWPEEVCAKCT